VDPLEQVPTPLLSQLGLAVEAKYQQLRVCLPS